MRSKRVFIGITLLLFCAGTYDLLFRHGYIETLKLANRLQEQKQTQQQEMIEDQRTLEKLKKIILLPENTVPTMAIITDAEVLKSKNPVFFANTKNGDRLIVYPDMAIVYDEHLNKIIKIGPVQYASP